MRAALWMIFCLSVLISAACGGGGGDGRRLKIYAAASLREAVTELAAEYGERHGVEPIFNFGSSGKLAIQIEQGGHADVFLSASETEMEKLSKNGRLLEDTRRTLLSNQLVIVVPTGGRRIEKPEDLCAEWLERVSLANTMSVPAGRYTKAWLQQIGLWEKIEKRALPGVDVRAALAAVQYGGADAGIVYSTDAAISDEVEITYAVPLDVGPKIAYPAACLTDSKRAAEGLRFIEFLQEPDSQAVFERLGFIVYRGQ